MVQTTTRKIRSKEKWAIVQEVIKGHALAKVAKTHDVTEEMLTRWVKAATTASIKSLKWTKEAYEKPKLRTIQLQQNFSFPTQLLRHVDSAVFFFCAQFFGRNDTIYAYTAGVPHVLCNDINEEHLAHMKKIYPPHWEYNANDAFAAARDLAVENRKFDLVMCDPFTSFTVKVLDDYQAFRKLATKYLIVFASQKATSTKLLDMGIDLKNETYNLQLLKQIDETIKHISFHKRSNHDEGSYSIVFHF